MTQWIISPANIEMKAERRPNGFKCCALGDDFNDLLLNGESKISHKYSYIVDAVSLPNGKESLFGKFHIHKDGELIYRTERFGPIHATFIYDAQSRCLTSNLVHSMLPKELGGLSPSGMYMANVMAYDILRESGLLFIHGGAFQLDGRTVCIFSPSQTGKTTVISKLIQNGAKYLGEDAILTDGKIVHLVPPHKLDKFGVLSKDDIMRYSKIDCAYICDYGKKNGGDKRSKAISYLRILSNRVPFHNDGLVQALIAYQGQDFRDLENKAVDVVERLVDNADVRFISNLNEMAADLDGC